MAVIMGVSLYTSRITLLALGVTDYGIYNVVGGVVGMLAFLNTSLNNATQRYLNNAIGKRAFSTIKKVFSVSLWSYIGLGIIAFCLAETVGLWFVKTQLNIPSERLDAGLWVYHCSVLSFIANLVVVPYNATIIAHEKMSIYAWISMLDIFLKLGIVYILLVSNSDKLMLFGTLVLVVTVINSLIYALICIRRFEECTFKLIWDKTIFKGLFSFSSWILIEVVTRIISSQGVNIIINIFFGPVYNAARGIAMQVYFSVDAFCANFMVAIKPQVVKSYASGDIGYTYRLTYSASKMAYYLLFIISLPLLFHAPLVLDLWLKEVPAYTVLFTQIALADLVLRTAFYPLSSIAQASGKIRNFQILLSISNLLIFVLTYIAYVKKMPVESTFYICIIIDSFSWIARLIILKIDIQFPIREYYHAVLIPIFRISAIAICINYGFFYLYQVRSIMEFAISVIITTFLTSLIIYSIGLQHVEKQMIISIFKSKIKL